MKSRQKKSNLSESIGNLPALPLNIIYDHLPTFKDKLTFFHLTKKHARVLKKKHESLLKAEKKQKLQQFSVMRELIKFNQDFILISGEWSQQEKMNALNQHNCPLLIKQEDEIGIFGYCINGIDKTNTKLIALNPQVFQMLTFPKDKEFIKLNCQDMNADMRFEIILKSNRRIVNGYSTYELCSILSRIFKVDKEVFKNTETFEKSFVMHARRLIEMGAVNHKLDKNLKIDGCAKFGVPPYPNSNRGFYLCIYFKKWDVNQLKVLAAIYKDYHDLSITIECDGRYYLSMPCDDFCRRILPYFAFASLDFLSENEISDNKQEGKQHQCVIF